MLDRETIEKHLTKMPRDFAVAFAVRAAMRVMPILANNKGKNEAFGFWGQDKAINVFSVMHVERSGFLAVATRSARANANAFKVRAYAVAYSAAYAADAVYAAAAADDASRFATYCEDVQKTMLNELNLINSLNFLA